MFYWVPVIYVSLSVHTQPACFLYLQGEMVDNIEKNVSNAVEYICSAKEETKKAVRWQKKSRRVCILVMLCSVINNVCYAHIKW